MLSVRHEERGTPMLPSGGGVHPVAYEDSKQTRSARLVCKRPNGYAALIEPCKLNGVEPHAYLADVMTKILKALGASA